MFGRRKKMSRVGRMPINLPSDVKVEIENSKITVKGHRGELTREIHPDIELEIKDSQILVKRKSSGKEQKSIHGLTRTLLSNMIDGVTKGFQKILEIHGTGYKAQKQENRLIMQLGFSKPKEVIIPENLEISFEGGNLIYIKGIEKELVGLFAAKVRKVKPVEPYKGRGIRYQGENIRRKAGKTGKVVAK